MVIQPPATFNDTLASARLLALSTLIHLASDLSNPSQARLAASAILRIKPEDDEPDPDRATGDSSASTTVQPVPPPDTSDLPQPTFPPRASAILSSARSFSLRSSFPPPPSDIPHPTSAPLASLASGP